MPKLNSFAAVDIGISSSTTKALFLDNVFVSDLALTTENKNESPWLVVFQERDKPNTLESALGNFTTSSVHITEGRWFTLVTSSFAHKDIDLLRNLTAILVTMPIIERLMKLLLSLVSIFSSLISL